MSEITWYGHSAFGITCGDAAVVIDPFFHASPEGLRPRKADLVLVTHDHGDHTGEAVALCQATGAKLGAIVGTAAKLAAQGLPEGQVLNGIGFNMGGTLTHKGIAVTMTQAFHSSDSGSPAGYIVRMPDGAVIYHAGDTCLFSSMSLWGQLYAIDVALLPVGGVFTMDGPQAAIACRLLRCRAAIPMHWGTFPVLDGVEPFLAAAAEKAPECRIIAMKPGETTTVTPRA